MHIHEPGEHGRGFRVMAGDRPVIPAGWIQISLNPLKSTVQFTRPGLEMAAATFLLEELHQKEEEYPELATRLEAQTDAMLTAFPPLAGLDINNSEHTEQILTIMQDHKAAPEFWALWTGQFLAVARQAVQDGETTRAVWATACAERCRSMLVFKQSLEDVVWMGYSAKRIINALGIWDAQRKNSDEEFWQLTFNENSYVLSQVFAIPMVFLKDKAYVGGMKLVRIPRKPNARSTASRTLIPLQAERLGAKRRVCLAKVDVLFGFRSTRSPSPGFCDAAIHH